MPRERLAGPIIKDTDQRPSRKSIARSGLAFSPAQKARCKSGTPSDINETDLLSSAFQNIQEYFIKASSWRSDIAPATASIGAGLGLLIGREIGVCVEQDTVPLRPERTNSR
jgi:hypothetical protein